MIIKQKYKQKIYDIIEIVFMTIYKYIILFIVGGTVYLSIELLFRGYSHWTMFILGGICFIYIGGLNNWFDYNMSLIKQMTLSTLIITLLEYITGYIVNIKLHWNIWDYSDLPFNIQGQICIPFMFVWFFLSLIAIWLDDVLRYLWFEEEKPHYKIF